MKRALSLLLSLVLLLALLPGCQQSDAGPEPSDPAPESEETRSAQELAGLALLLSGRDEALNVEYLNTDEDPDRLAVYIESICGLTQDQWEDAAVIRGTRASAFEIVVLRLEDEDAAAQVEAVLTDYLTVREGAFTGYAPAEAEMAANGKVRREGCYVALCICPDPAGASTLFEAGPDSLPAPEPVQEPEPEADAFEPSFELYDLLFRMLLEAACPEWGGLQDDKGWTDATGGGLFATEIEAKYGISRDQYVECDRAYWGPRWYEGLDYDGETAHVSRNSHELVLFQAATEDIAQELAQTLNDYKASRLEELEELKSYEGSSDFAQLIREHAEAEAATLENTQIISSGHYAALIASDHVEDAVRLFPRAVNDPSTNEYFRRYMEGIQSAPPSDPDPDYPDRIRFNPPNEEDMSIYDTSAILTAWENRDPSSLSGDDRAIYDAAESLLESIMEEGMTDLEKETAAYHWLVENVDYDWSHQDVLAETDRRGFGPYGGLVNRAAVCLGYATSFQLLMDMSGIECITIVGAGANNMSDHAWNMVKLNGEWYCADVAWDANARELTDNHEWQYFNLTSDEMAKNHQWDYANTPEATAQDRGQG